MQALQKGGDSCWEVIISLTIFMAIWIDWILVYDVRVMFMVIFVLTSNQKCWGITDFQ